MKKDLTELVFILDRSGSMAGSESDVVGGFNTMIAKQKKEEGECLVTAVLFSTESRILIDRAKIGDVKPLTVEEYEVGGGTALFDAVGTQAERIFEIQKYAREEDVPEHTVFVISTDGYENSSRSFGKEDIRKLIQTQTSEKGWQFIFTAADIDASEDGRKMGIPLGNCISFEKTEMFQMFEQVSDQLCSIRKNCR